MSDTEGSEAKVSSVQFFLPCHS